MGVRRFLLLAGSLLAAASCAPVEKRALPRPPPPWGDHPAIGRVLDLPVADEHGHPVRLGGARGRVTVICVLAPDGAGAPPPPCDEVVARWEDRVTVAGLVTSGPVPETPYRVFRDEGGKMLKDKLTLGPEPRVIVLDRQRRVAALVEPGMEARLDEALNRLAH